MDFLQKHNYNAINKIRPLSGGDLSSGGGGGGNRDMKLTGLSSGMEKSNDRHPKKSQHVSFIQYDYYSFCAKFPTSSLTLMTWTLLIPLSSMASYAR